MTVERLIEELDSLVKLRPVQHLDSADPQPHRHARHRDQEPARHQGRGQRPGEIERAAEAIERVVKDIPGVTSAFAERVTGGRYIEVNVDRDAASRSVCRDGCAVGRLGCDRGENVGETIEGRRRFPINVRYPRELRDSLDKLRDLPMITEVGADSLGAVARIVIADGPLR